MTGRHDRMLPRRRNRGPDHCPGLARMTTGPPVLPLAAAGDAVRYMLIDDEPRYRQALAIPDGLDLALAGSYGTVEAFIAIQRQPCHVVVLDLCLNRQTGDHAVLQGVRAIRQLSDQLSHRVVVYTADERPEPVVRCVAAGAAAYVSKYDDSSSLARGIRGRQARQHRQRRAAPGATQACSELPRHPAVRHVGGDPHAARNRDERSADRQEATTFGAHDRRSQAQDPGNLRHRHGGSPTGPRRPVPRPGHPTWRPGQ
jgi:DNA-binding NarL/FixJ family response regulator